MIRFAFNPNQSTLDLYRELEEMGVNTALSEVFRLKRLKKDRESNSHKEFVHKKEVLDFLKTIDGKKEDPNVLSFLDLERIREGKMCRHMVFVLPYRASCDAMESLISEHKSDFKHLGDYEIINISGVDNEAKYKTTEDVRHKISEYEENNKKTITLTVNRMLTGSTVKEWDAMLFLKDTSSPQEYDQAIFRLQNQYVVTLVDEEETVRYNMKPQTLLVDFDPNRMFRLQEHRSQVYNANTEQSGNQKLRERIETELSYSPIITIDKSGLKRVEATDIMDVIREYSANRSVMDEVSEIPLDYALLNDGTIRNAISKLNPINTSKGIEIRPVEGEEEDLNATVSPAATPSDNEQLDDVPINKIDEREENLGQKLATYYAQILFYAFLTDSSVKNLEEVIGSIDDCINNKRIARHTGLQKSVLKMIQEKSNVFVLRALDYKIENINSLINDDQLDPSNRVEVALRKFSRLSSSEVVTPQWVAHDMIEALNRNEVTSDTHFLDIASKQGEFTRALIEEYGDGVAAVADNIYAIPTSTITYEFTRKVYSLLGLNPDHVFSEFTTYDLLNEEKKNGIMSMLNDMKFDVVIGNPPYQEADGGARASAKPIYPLFVNSVKELMPQISVIIMPARWYTGGKGLDQFRIEMLEDIHVRLLCDYLRPEEVFPDTNNRGGLCFFVRDLNFDNGKDLTTIITQKSKEETTSYRRNLKTGDLNVFIRHQESVGILEKVVKKRALILWRIISHLGSLLGLMEI